MTLLIDYESLPDNVFVGEYHLPVVLISYFIVVISSYIAISILRFIRSPECTEKTKPTIIGALVIGVGIWSMHYTGMLAYKLTMVHEYDLFLTVLSMLIAVIFSLAVFYNITREHLSFLRIIISAPLMGVGVAAMHYTGMAAMKMDGEIVFIAPVFYLSIAIAIIASAAAMVIMRGVVSSDRYQDLLHYAAALAMGAAVCGMHYTGMAATRFIPYADCKFDAQQNHILFSLSVIVIAFFIILLGELFLKKMYSSKNYVSFERVGIISTGIMAIFILFAEYSDFEYSLEEAKNDYRQRANHDASDAALAVENKLNTVYGHLVTISRLPSIRNIDVKQKNVSPDAWEAFHGVYDSLKKNIDISEVYVVSSDIKPDYDPTVGKSGSIILSIEDFSEAIDNVEDEIAEYKILSGQMAELKEKYGRITELSAESPSVFLVSSEVSTCDKRKFLLTGKESDRSGSVFSVPFYGNNGELRGTVSAIIRRDVLRKLPIGSNNILQHKSSGLTFIPEKPGEIARDFSLNPGILRNNFIYSETIEFEIGKSGDKWQLFAALPDSEFYDSSRVRDIISFHRTSYILVVVISLMMLAGIKLMGRYTKRIAKEKQKLQTVMDTVLDAIITINDKGIVIGFNHAAERAFGYSEAEVLGKNVKMLMSDKHAEHHDDYLTNYLTTGERKIIGIGRVVEAKRKDGTFFPIDLSVNEAIGQEGEHYFVGSIRDITERLRLEAGLRQERDRAEEAAKAKSMFLANMSHEIRTPMNGILGVGSLLEDTPLNKQQKEYVETIERSARSLLTIINEILDFSKIEQSGIVLENYAFDLKRFVMDQVHLLQPSAAQKSLYLNAEIDKNIPKFVYGDEGRLRQVLINIIGNAIKFTSTGGIKLTIERDMLFIDEILLKFSVSDTGTGIPKNKQDKLFDPFYQVSSGTTKTEVGTGLGLAICKKICEAMGGEIGLESEVGKGTTFLFTLRFAMPSEEQVEDEVARIKSLNPDVEFKPKHILVAEDVTTNQFVIKNILKLLKCTFDIAKNGEEAVEMAKNNVYDVILMDCHMPVMDGYEATGIIKRSDKGNIPIIALTANASQNDRTHCLASGMDDFISKPFTKGDIVRVLNKWFGEKYES